MLNKCSEERSKESEFCLFKCEVCGKHLTVVPMKKYPPRVYCPFKDSSGVKCGADMINLGEHRLIGTKE
jgi:hypothetical protein